MRAATELRPAVKVSAGTGLINQVIFLLRTMLNTRKEYLRRYAGNKQKNPYNDKMLRSTPYNYNENNTRNYKK